MYIYIYTHLSKLDCVCGSSVHKVNKGFVQALTWFMVLIAYVLGKIKIHYFSLVKM